MARRDKWEVQTQRCEIALRRLLQESSQGREREWRKCGSTRTSYHAADATIVVRAENKSFKKITFFFSAKKYDPKKNDKRVVKDKIVN